MSDLQSPTQAPLEVDPQELIAVGKTRVLSDRGDEVVVFTMTLGEETIELLPLRNWSQLDVYKWRARGKLPGTPAGLEITFDHVKVSGEAVAINDPDGTAKLQKLLNEWLALERRSFDLARQKARAKPAVLEEETAAHSEEVLPNFQVEVDKKGQVHIHCRQGKETLATIGLNLPGFVHLFNEGLMHKPRTLKVGALHDWVELDGELFSFEHGNNDAGKLEEVLNHRYLSAAALAQGKDVLVFTNAASSTGFDIQFPAKVGGVTERRRRPLNEEALDLLQSPEKCGLAPKDLVIKLSRPNLIFKRKTFDGGERYLNERPENVVTVIGDDGELTMVDLSKPVNYLHLSAVELTAVFNHPTINQRSRAVPEPARAGAATAQTQASAPPRAERPMPPSMSLPQSPPEARPVEIPRPQPEMAPPRQPVTPALLEPASDRGGPLSLSRSPLEGERVPKAGEGLVHGPDARREGVEAPPKTSGSQSATSSAPALRPLPNLWLKEVLSRASLRQDWFPCLVYRKLAEHFGNSEESFFGPFPCWVCSLGDVADISDPAFRGVFLTQKGWLGYLNQGHLVRFHNEVVFLGTLESTIEGIGVSLVGAGTDAHQRIVFIVTENYRTKFGLPDLTVAQALARLRESGASLMSVNEVLQSPDPIEVVWTVPAHQENPDDPQAMEDVRPELSPLESSP
jgi:hypothetical protein